MENDQDVYPWYEFGNYKIKITAICGVTGILVQREMS